MVRISINNGNCFNYETWKYNREPCSSKSISYTVSGEDSEKNKDKAIPDINKLIPEESKKQDDSWKEKVISRGLDNASENIQKPQETQNQTPQLFQLIQPSKSDQINPEEQKTESGRKKIETVVLKQKERQNIINDTKKKTNESHNMMIEDLRLRNEKILKLSWKTIKDLQIALNKKMGTKLKEDDIFWKNALRTLVAFQKKNKLLQSWEISKETLLALFNDLKIEKEYVETTQKFSKKLKNMRYARILSDFITEKRYISHKKDSCWASVWNILTAFWIKWLPTTGRDWHKWDDFLENHPDFIKVPISDPREAKPGAILVYDKWFWKWARKTYWHVEVATDEWFYYGTFKSIPWWSTNSWFTGHAYYYVWPDKSSA